jgi:hypothetical protein
MGYLKFTMSHPFLFMAILLFAILYPLFFISMFFLFDLSLDISLIVSPVITLGFIALIIFPTLLKQGKKEFNMFIKNLGSIVSLSKPFLNLIETKDFTNLRILYFGKIKKHNAKKRVGLNYALHGAKWGSIATSGDIMLEKGSEFYKNSVEGKFSFAFSIPRSDVKISVPEFNYSESLSHFTKDFNDWKLNYPNLEIIYKDLPKWVDKLEIFYHDETVFISLFADGEFCLKNSATVYNKLVGIKNKLINS